MATMVETLPRTDASIRESVISELKWDPKLTAPDDIAGTISQNRADRQTSFLETSPGFGECFPQHLFVIHLGKNMVPRGECKARATVRRKEPPGGGTSEAESIAPAIAECCWLRWNSTVLCAVVCAAAE